MWHENTSGLKVTGCDAFSRASNINIIALKLGLETAERAHINRLGKSGSCEKCD